MPIRQAMPKVPFVDLTAQYTAIAEEINEAAVKVLRGTDFILGRDVALTDTNATDYAIVIGSDVARDFDEVMMIVPVDGDVEEAQDVAQENWNERLYRSEIGAVRGFHLKHHNGDDDRKNAVAEGFEAVFFHGWSAR